MKILVVTQYFWPENFRINDLCQQFVNDGHQVTVLTGEPNYPDGKLYKDYINNKSEYDTFEGCEIIRAPIIPRGNSHLKLILNYISFVVSGCLTALFRMKNHNFDKIFVCQLSPVTSALPAVFYGKLFKVPIYMWVLDLWPDSLSDAGNIDNKLLNKIFGSLTQFIYSSCETVLAQSNTINNVIKERSPDTKVKTLYNWSEDFFSKTCTSSYRISDNSKTILFAGNVGESQNLEHIIYCFSKALKYELSLKFYIAGDGRNLKNCRLLVEELNIENSVLFLGSLPLEDMPALYASVDFCLVTLKKNFAFSLTLPGKVQSYMAASKPIISISAGECNLVINDAQCGFIADPEDVDSIIQAFKEADKVSFTNISKLGLKSKKYYENNFSKKHQISKLYSIFNGDSDNAK